MDGVLLAECAQMYDQWTVAVNCADAPICREVSGACCHGDTPTLADLCLVPQVFNARRFDCDLTSYPELVRIADTCAALPPFAAAAPDRVGV